MKNAKSISELQKQLKADIVASINSRVGALVKETVRKYIRRNVYQVYAPSGDFAYERTFQLLNSVQLVIQSEGYKYIKFEVFMDTGLIDANITDAGQWNQHADVWDIDVTDMIPYWVEYGTSNSLWDRNAANYMGDAHFELSGGALCKSLAAELRKCGWKVKVM